MKIFFITPSLLILSSCTWGWNTTPPVVESPYPKVAIDATGVTLAPVERGSSFVANGTEPFWSADISPTSVSYSTPGETDTITKIYETRQSEQNGMIIVKDAKGEFFITLKKEECSNGMSDIKFPYTATVLMGADTLKGCAKEGTSK